ncbi:F0F1 ATP synthase subunit epsilon [bacterium]|nr:F0F1 ATP synthase subunit epsilon [bacterium]
MPPLFHLKIISPERVEFDGEVDSLIAPAEDGYVGILANHAPLLATLGEGDLTLSGPQVRHSRYHIRGDGFLEVHQNRAVILTQRVEAGG